MPSPKTASLSAIIVTVLVVLGIGYYSLSEDEPVQPASDHVLSDHPASLNTPETTDAHEISVPTRTENAAPDRDSAKPGVVVSINPLAMLIRSIAGTNIQIDVLLPPGSNPHFYQLKPSDITKMKNAKEVFWVGEGFEVYLKKVFTAHQIRNTTIEALAGVELDDEPHTHHDQNGAIHKLSEQGHQDPHLWLDPYLILDIIPEVRSRLSKFYPESAGAFAKNSEQTTTAINLLIEDYTTQFKSESSRPVFSAHDAFRRLSDRLGFTLVDSFADSAEKKPGIGHLKRMQEKIRALEKVCFLEELGTTSFYTKSIPAETDVKRAQIDLLGQTLTGTATYPEYLAQLLSTLRECTRL